MKYIFKKKYLTVLMSALDFLGGCVVKCADFKGVSRNAPTRDARTDTDPTRILLIRLDHIGDVMMATAVIKPLREKYPDAEINIMVPGWAYDLVEGNPYIDNIIVFSPPWFTRKKKKAGEHINGLLKMRDLIKEGQYDIAVDLRGDMRHITAMYMAKVPKRISYGITGCGFLLTDMVSYEEKTHEIDRNNILLSEIGAGGEKLLPEIFFSDEDIKITDILKEEYNISGKYAVFHPVPGDTDKLRDISIFRDAALHVYNSYGIAPVFIGGADDNKFIEELISDTDINLINLSGKTGLKVLAGLLKKASLFIGVDSGPAHISAAVGAPTVILFSETNDPDEWAPRGNDVRIVRPGCSESINSIIDGMVRL